MDRFRHRWLYLLPLYCLLQVACIPAQADTGPAAMLQDVTEKVLAEIRKNPEQLKDINRVRALTERFILPHIDFQAAAQWVLGKYWRTASSGQRKRFAEEFRQLLVNTYVRSISNYSDNRITISPARGALSSGRAEVDAQIERPDGPPVHLGFRMHRSGAEWLVYDISVEGVSLVATHRSTFAREIHDTGLDGLIEHLASMNGGKAAGPEDSAGSAMRPAP